MRDHRNETIDDMRGMAVILVVLYHFFPSFVTAGYVGVDVFLVISGYVITESIKRNPLYDTNDLIKFYKRRILRLSPSMLFILAVSSSIAYFFYFDKELRLYADSLLASLFYFQNEHVLKTADYFNQDAYNNPLIHFWSLSVEMQFYALFPFVFLICSTRSFFALRVLIFTFVVLSFVYCVFGDFKNLNESYLGTLTRIWQLGVGSLVSLFSSSFKDKLFKQIDTKTRCLKIAHAITISTLGYFAVTFESYNRYPGLYASVPTFLTAFVIILAQTNSPVSQHLHRKFLNYVGKISYPLYLSHWIFLSNYHVLIGDDISLHENFAILGLSIFIAIISYEFVEQKSKQMSLNQNLIAFFSVVFILVIFALSIKSASGIYRPAFISALDTKISTIIENDTALQKEIMQPGKQTCNERYGRLLTGRAYCHSNNSADPDILLIGDSHAESLFFGFSKVLDGKQTVHTLGTGGCAPFSDEIAFGRRPEGGKNCKSEMEPLLQEVVKTNAKVIIVSSLNAFYLGGISFQDFLLGKQNNGVPKTTSGIVQNENKQNFEKSIEKFLQFLVSNGQRVILLLDNPHLSITPYRCITNNNSVLPKFRTSCNSSSKSLIDYEAEARKIILKVVGRTNGVTIFDSKWALCDGDVCPVVKNGKLLYRDKDHLSVEGAAIVAKSLMQQFSLYFDG